MKKKLAALLLLSLVVGCGESEQDAVGALEKLGVNLKKNKDGRVVAFRSPLNLKKSIELEGKLTDDQLRHIKPLVTLKLVSIDSKVATDAGLRHLQGLKNLETLFISEAQVTDAGLAYLSGNLKLTQLKFMYTPITGSGLAHLPKHSCDKS